MRSQAFQGASRRITIVRICFLLVFLVLAGRAAQLTLSDDRGRLRDKRQRLSEIQLAPARGGIFDRSEKALAMTVLAPSIYVSPTEMENPSRAIKALARALELDRSELSERLRGRAQFTYVARWVSQAQADAVAALDLPGVGITSEPRRIFPAGSLAGRILGFANIDGVGVRGIEKQEDAWLRGREHRVSVERDARRRMLAAHAIRPSEAAGGDIALTIDAAMQADLESALRHSVEESSALGGFVIALDPHSGEILALAEEPAFDPNQFRVSPFAETRSFAFHDALEPGSTFKVFLAAAALETRVVDESTRLDCRGGSYRVRGKTIRDHRDYGVIDVATMIGVSSNCGATKVAELLGPERHADALRRFGFGSPTGSGFPFESAGLLRPWRKWKATDRAAVAFGQGISVTPIQLAAALGAVANGGTWHTPHLIAKRRAPGEAWRGEPRGESRRVLSEETSRRVLKMMEGVVSAQGTGRRAALRDVRVAGKTGTAQKFDRELGTYSQTRYLASFMGVVPADDPKLVVIAALDEPQGLAHGGGDVAAPLFARAAANQLARFGIATAPRAIRAQKYQPMMAEPAPSEQETDVAQALPPAREVPQAPRASDAPGRLSKDRETRETASSGSSRSALSVLVPEFRGATVSEAKQLAAEYTVDLELNGVGLAVTQDPAPGTILTGSHRVVRVRFSAATGEG